MSFQARLCDNTSVTIGTNCNISATACDVLDPCENMGTCITNITIPMGYQCNCATGFTGAQCQVDQRQCQPNLCLNGGRVFGATSVFQTISSVH